MALDLTLSCKEYRWTEPLKNGDVEVEGVNLNVVDGYSSPERFTRMLKNEEFDLCELSMGSYLVSREMPEYTVTAIPVFPHRRFRQSFLFKHKESELSDPKELNGGDIGVVNWQTTTGLWVRGVLGEYHDLDLESVTWHLAGTEILPIDIPDSFDVNYIPEDRYGHISRSSYKLFEMAKDSELDAFIYTSGVNDPEIVRFFDEPWEVERNFYRDTGIFPIMHNVAFDDEIVDENPWVVNKVFEAFSEALEIVMDDVASHGWFKLSPFVWSLQHLEEQRQIMGDSPWENGLTESNTKNLEKLVKYAHHQGLISEEYTMEDLFLPHSETGMFG